MTVATKSANFAGNFVWRALIAPKSTYFQPFLEYPVSLITPQEIEEFFGQFFVSQCSYPSNRSDPQNSLLSGELNKICLFFQRMEP